ncbi:MAG: SLBB domain-containing protein [Arcobacteraceae bacterium]|jgi:protein involved in polysaccharide export with SLBB domain|nr:SLBB domain-containing protein [Arcobacteraceae bacterium]
MSKKILGTIILLFVFLITMAGALPVDLNDPAVIEQLKKDKLLQEQVKKEYTKSDVEKQTEEKVSNISVVASAEGQEKGEAILLEHEHDMSDYIPFLYENQMKLIEQLSDNKVKLTSTVNLKRFGKLFFEATSSEPLAHISPPDDYMLSYGDTLKISIYGVDNLSYTLTIDKEGNIDFPRVGYIQVLGLNYSDARVLLIEKVGIMYPNSTVLVSISNLRSISVSVVGEATKPGLYNIPALSKVKDALMYAGGVSDIGSMRYIEVRRENNIIARFDLYTLIKYGDSTGDIVLRTGDVIFVPTAKKLVSLDGNIKHPAVFELKSGETLVDLINFSGGANSDSIKSVKVQRSTDGKKSFIEASLKEPLSLNDGDKVYVGKTSDVVENKVQLMGNVYRQEAVEIKDGDSVGLLVSNLIKEYGLEKVFMPQTDMEYFIVKRINPKTLNIETYSGNLEKVLNGQKEFDVSLQSRDRIFFFNKSMTEDIKYITIVGEVLRSGKLNFYKGMKLQDALMAAGVKKESDLDKIMIMSLSPSKEKEVNFYSYSEAANIYLKEYDEITIDNFFKTQEQEYITIKGAVIKSGEFPYVAGLRMQDVLLYTKGLKNSARMDEFELVSYIIEDNTRIPQVSKISLQEAIDNNIEIKAYDEIYIQQIQGWNENNLVTLRGEVKFPGTYAITPGERLSSVIQRAGGFTDSAFVKGAVFVRDDVKKIQQEALKKQLDDLESSIVIYATQGENAGGGSSEDKAFLLKHLQLIKQQANEIEMVGRVAIELNSDLQKLAGTYSDLILKNGDSLVVPKFEDSISVVGEVMYQTAVTFIPNESVMKYIERVGGLKDGADKDNIFVVRANGEAQKIKSGYLSGYSSVKIERGDTVIVPLKIDRFSGMKFAKDITSIVYQLAVSAAALKTIGAL